METKDLLDITQPDPRAKELEQFFETPEQVQDVQSSIAAMAEQIVLEDEALSKLQAEVDERKEKLVAAKEALADTLLQNGMQSVKLESGLTPSIQITRKFYKQSGIDDEQIFEWLNKNELGYIIKPTVHFGTLQTTLRAFDENGGAVPAEIFNVSDERSIRMNGKSKFLAARQNIQNE